jgi:hypothetical protein
MDPELSLSPAAIDALADDIADTAAHIDAATHRLLVMIREFDRARGWAHQGALTCAHWLSWRIGLGIGPAREKVRVAHKLAELPLLDEAFRRGELSYSKLRAMTRVATAANEAELLELARCSTAAQLERICRFYCQARRQAGQDARVIEDERRWVVSRPTEDGMVSIQIRLLPDEAARLMRAIELGAAHGSLADGAVALAETVLLGSSSAADARRDSCGEGARAGSSAVDPRRGSSAEDARTGSCGEDARTGSCGEDACTGAPAEDVRASSSSMDLRAGADMVSGRAPAEPPSDEVRASRAPLRPPVEVVVHITAANLEGTTDVGDGLSAETCRRLLCDAGVVPMLEDASGKTIDVGRKTRSVPPALRRALNARDKTCRFPGCTHRRMLDAHHLRHWIDGGETSLENTALCCRRHHRYLHDYGFAAEMRDGELVFLDPEGHEIPPVVQRPPLPDGSFDRLRAQIQRHGIAISAETNSPGWDGLPVDYDACVNAIGGWDPM